MNRTGYENRRTVCITGASGGIGRAIASAFAAAGPVRLALHAHSRADDLRSWAEGLKSDSVSVGVFQADLRDRRQAFEMIQAVEAAFGPLDVLVNNAGIAQQKLFTDLTQADWQNMVDTNLSGPVYTTQAALPGMIRRRTGTVINVSSMWGETGASCEAHYSAVKAGLIGLTRALAKEVGPSHITVNCVAPGVIDTPMNAALSDADRACLADETPLGRIGQPAEVAGLVVYLASESAAFITGQVIGVNGGLVIG